MSQPFSIIKSCFLRTALNQTYYFMEGYSYIFFSYFFLGSFFIGSLSTGGVSIFLFILAINCSLVNGILFPQNMTSHHLSLIFPTSVSKTAQLRGYLNFFLNSSSSKGILLFLLISSRSIDISGILYKRMLPSQV